MKIAGSRILITGGASGIGLATARRLVGLGAEIVVVDNNREALEVLTDPREACGFEVQYCDVSQPGEVEALIGRLTEASAGLHAVINNAAILRDQALASRLGKRIKKHSLEDWQATLNSNLTGTFLVAREVAAAWISQKRSGVIVNTSSVVRTGNPGQSAYSATKAAIDALTVTWAQELAPYKIRVAAIAYGFAETGMTRKIAPLFQERIKTKSVVGRFAAVAELAAGIEFILENEYCAGRTLDLDGGLRF